MCLDKVVQWFKLRIFRGGGRAGEVQNRTSAARIQVRLTFVIQETSVRQVKACGCLEVLSIYSDMIG